MSMKLYYFVRLDVQARMSVSAVGPSAAHRRPPTRVCAREIFSDFIVSISDTVQERSYTAVSSIKLCHLPRRAAIVGRIAKSFRTSKIAIFAFCLGQYYISLSGIYMIIA